VIPARGGSKRIPRKNIKNFCGKPMISWSVEAALSCDVFDLVVVSTDDEDIAEIARECGAQVPFLRPLELANDFVATVPVVKHAIEELDDIGVVAANICCLYATAPFVQSADIKLGLRKLLDQNCDYVFTVTTFASPIQRALRQSKDGYLEMLSPEMYECRSQDLPETWHDAGQFYWGHRSSWLRDLPIFSAACLPLMVPRHRVQDIDTLEDWQRAEWLFKMMLEDLGVQ
jgi:N-acylneuraminate cytidylyltransferase